MTKPDPPAADDDDGDNSSKSSQEQAMITIKTKTKTKKNKKRNNSRGKKEESFLSGLVIDCFVFVLKAAIIAFFVYIVLCKAIDYAGGKMYRWGGVMNIFYAGVFHGIPVIFRFVSCVFFIG